MDKKYVKVMFGTKSSADKNLKYKIGVVNIADNWNPEAKTDKEFGGFNFSTEDKIIRWIHRGDTIYDVYVPEDAEVVNIKKSATPNGVFRTNKIIIANPRKVTDNMALELYNKSTIPEFSYYKALAACAVRGYRKTSLKILEDKVRKDNIDIVLDEWYDFINNGGKGERKGYNKLVDEIEKMLLDIKAK